jgi:hypothetical protein
MRYSPFSPRASQKLGSASASNERFFAEVGKSAGQRALHGAILLVGARDTLALALRRAQGVLRFDQRPSKWSHAALIVRWQGDVGASAGVEVTLDPLERQRQVPERNGVTTFTLSRYFEEQRYPNVALLSFELEEPERVPGMEGTLPSAAERRALVLETALTPVKERERFPLWDMLGTWARHAYLPFSTPNPLLEGVPLPCASLCEYAYEAAGIDLTPGTTGNHNCPEVLYATAKHWAEGVASTQRACVRLYSLERDEHVVPHDELTVRIDELELPARSELGGAAPARGAKKAPRKKR